MAITLNVGGVEFEYPTQGQQGWAEEATGWAQAVTNQLALLTVTGDIAHSIVDIDNSITDLKDVVGLVFDNTYVKGAEILYSIERETNATTKSESGTIHLSFDVSANTATGSITTFTAANPSVVTTGAAHGLDTGDKVIIENAGDIDGLQVVTVTGGSTFTVPVNSAGGTGGTFEKTRWKQASVQVGDADVTLCINDDGQMKYTSTDIGGTGYSGTMRFRARVLRSF
jgi:hypothetical protein